MTYNLHPRFDKSPMEEKPYHNSKFSKKMLPKPYFQGLFGKNVRGIHTRKNYLKNNEKLIKNTNCKFPMMINWK